MNVNGGAIAIGHPLGMSGARLVVTLLHELRRRSGRYGIATMCVGVGQAGGAVRARHRDAVTRTQVAIVGAGPAGLTLAQLLHVAGIDSVILEARSRAYVEARVRAGVLERDVAELFARAGVGERMRREGLVHTGVELQSGRERHRIAFDELTGKTIVVYGQTEVVKDLIAARLESGRPLLFEVADVSLHGLESERPRVRYVEDGADEELECDFVAGSTASTASRGRASRPTSSASSTASTPTAGSGSSRPSRRPARSWCTHTPSAGSRSSACARRTSRRLYLQCAPDEDLELWPDGRIWEELQERLGVEGWTLREGPILEKGVTPMRSLVVEPMQWGRLFLAGDAAHIVPPTGAKGLNLAVGEVAALGRRWSPGTAAANRSAERFFRDLPPAGLARPPLLVVDDLGVCTAPGDDEFTLQFSSRSLATRVSHGRDLARGELRGGRARLTS